ncbi:MAG: SDR family oxidoreductase [Geodermatophilaceae bacterium]|nr:SDR family oxidoreductase [Geodermatophilaceae bacterium]
MSPVAFITGAASGIGAAAARRLAAREYRTVLADIDPRGAETAAEVGGRFTRLDVTDLDANRACVADLLATEGRLDVAFLNAGVTGPGDALPLQHSDYRRILGVNLDGVVFGIDACAAAMTDGGAIVATASLAGLSPMPGDALYTLTKTAVVGYVRALAPSLARHGITLNALCPGFADTPLITDMREHFTAGGFPLLTADDVVDALCTVLDGEDTGQAWFVQPGLPAAPFRFGNVPAARRPDGEHARVPTTLGGTHS